jgi:hypothetical protein
MGSAGRLNMTSARAASPNVSVATTARFLNIILAFLLG